MKRDMDVIRKILLASMESNEPITSIEGIEKDTFNFNVMLIEEAGLANCIINLSDDGKIPTVNVAIVWRLTWNGFEFAQSIKDDKVWQKAYDLVIKPAGSWSFSILSEVIVFILKDQTGLLKN